MTIARPSAAKSLAEAQQALADDLRPADEPLNSFSKCEPPARWSSERQEADWEPEADTPPERSVSRAGNLSLASAASPIEADRRVERTGLPRETG